MLEISRVQQPPRCQRSNWFDKGSPVVMALVTGLKTADVRHVHLVYVKYIVDAKFSKLPLNYTSGDDFDQGSK